MINGNPNIYSIKETSEILRVCPRTLRRWDKSGRLKARRLLSGQMYYLKSDVKKALQVDDLGEVL